MPGAVERIVLVPRNGLGNRLQAWSSASILARAWDVPLNVLWEPEPAAPAPFDQLFAGPPEFAGLNHSWLNRAALDDLIGAPHEDLPRYLTMSADGRFAVLAGHDRGEQVFMDQVVALNERVGQPLTLVIIAGGLFHLHGTSPDAERVFRAERREFYSSLQWHGEILQRAVEVSPTVDYVALHLRTTDRSLEAPTDRVISSALSNMRSQMGVESLFIAADTPEGREIWSARALSLGFEPWSVNDTDFSRVTLSGGRSAAVDWLLLSRAKALTFAAASTFSSEAATAAGCEAWHLCGQFFHQDASQRALSPAQRGHVPVTQTQCTIACLAAATAAVVLGP